MISFKTGFAMAMGILLLPFLSLTFIVKLVVVPCVIAINYLLLRYVRSRPINKQVGEAQ